MSRAKQLPHEEVVEAWRDDQQGEYVQVNHDGSVVYVAHGVAMETIIAREARSLHYSVGLGTYSEHDMTSETVSRKIQDWMNEKKFWPNIWSVNDHGNVELLDKRGRTLGGIV